jgi:hypothetical protein
MTALAAAAALAGCAETEPGESDSFGSLAAAVTATGTDGATYRLPAGTYVQVWNDTFYDYWSMDGDMNILSVEVPVGDYYVALGHPTDTRSTGPLDRENPDATTETVNGTPSPQPVSVTVTAATLLAGLPFQVVDGGTVTRARAHRLPIDVNEAEHGRPHDLPAPTKRTPRPRPDSPPSWSPWSTRSAPVSSTRSWSAVGDWADLEQLGLLHRHAHGGTVSASYVELAHEGLTGGATARVCVYGGIYALYIFVTSTRTGPAVTATSP